MNPLAYDFFLNALLGVVLTGLITGIIGSYIVSRRMVFIAGGITHSSFAGLGFGFMTGLSPLFFAFVAAIMSGLGVEALSRKESVREDSAIAAVWSFGMALGVLFVFLTPGYAPSLSAFLFGNILLVTARDLVLLGLFLLLTIAFVLLFYKRLLFVSFDPEFARTKGLPVSLYRTAMMVWFCAGIVLSIRVMGIMMLMSLLSLPQMTVNLYTSDFRNLLLGSSLLGVSALLVSLFASFYLNIPTGACAVVLLSVLFMSAKAYDALRRH